MPGSPELLLRLLLPHGAHRNETLLAELAKLDVGPARTCTLSAGEAIYIPCNWYHSTENMEGDAESIAVDRQAAATIGLAFQWAPEWDASLYPTREAGSSQDFCASDVHADFRQTFAQAAALAQGRDVAAAAAMLEQACERTPVFVRHTIVAGIWVASFQECQQ